MQQGDAMNLMHQWALPVAASLPVWVALSWGVLVSACVLRWAPASVNARRLGLVVFLITAMPSLHVAGYLALAFQTPSWVAVAWALWVWRDALRGPHDAQAVTNPVSVVWPLLGVLLGWALVLDTLNSWPAWFNPQLYAWGFEASALWVVLAVCAVLLAWAAMPCAATLTVVGVLAAFALTRWPTGNVWDALLDPFVWIALHVQLWRAMWRQRRVS